MSTSAKAKVQIEVGQALTDYAAMTDSGDKIVFSIGSVWSGKSGYEADIRPDGVVSGRNMLTVSGTNDTVKIGAFSAYALGAAYDVTATTETFTRATSAGVSKINSVTMDSAGAIAVIAGDEGLTATFSELRDVAGGAPYIPAGSIEIGQIRVTSSTAGVLVSAELFQVVGTHVERFDYPVWEEENIGKGILAVSSAEQNSHIKFSSALPDIHTGDSTKKVYCKYYTPQMADLPKAIDFVPAEDTHSVASTQYYNGTIASPSSSLGMASFTALMTDNISDALMAEQNNLITVKFYPDRNKAPYILSQGTLGVARTHPVADQNQAACSLACEKASASFLS